MIFFYNSYYKVCSVLLVYPEKSPENTKKVYQTLQIIIRKHVFERQLFSFDCLNVLSKLKSTNSFEVPQEGPGNSIEMTY